jgi:hypothetical protein
MDAGGACSGSSGAKQQEDGVASGAEAGSAAAQALLQGALLDDIVAAHARWPSRIGSHKGPSCILHVNPMARCGTARCACCLNCLVNILSSMAALDVLAW